MTVAAGPPLAASGSLLGLHAGDSAEGVALAVLGAVIAWHGFRVYTGRLRVTPYRGRVFLQRPAIDWCALWCGSGLLLFGVGELLSIPAVIPVNIVGLILAVAGAVLTVAGMGFYVYMPRRLRPASERPVAAASPGDHRLRLVHHVLPGNTRSSEEEVKEIMGLDRPRLLAHGRIGGPLPYAAGISRTPRKGALWVVPGRVLFVQSPEDDRRLGETYFVEIPAEKLHGIRAADPGAKKQALEIAAGQGELRFECGGDAETLRHDILEVLNS